MPLIFDNLTATVIAMTVLLILSSIQLRATEQQVAQTSQQIVQQRARVATAWLEEDLGRIGENMTSDQEAVEQPEPYFDNPESDAKRWLTERFVFQRDSIASGGNIWRIEVRYRIDKQGTVSIGGEEKPVYHLTRERRRRSLGSGGWSDWTKGGEINSLEYFDVDLLDRNAQVTSNLNEVQSVRIRFSVVAPFQNEELAFPASRANVVVARYPLADS
ncbi:MAG: hypothetical protein ABEL51_07725 [Salinibacter sp.]